MLCKRFTRGLNFSPLLLFKLALIEEPNTFKCVHVYSVERGALQSMNTCAFLHARVQLMRFICVLFNEPWTDVPGQDEQLLSDWSVTWW